MLNVKGLLKKLEKEGFRDVASEERIGREVEDYGPETKILLADDDNFRIFLEDGKYVLETSYSNQVITQEWINKVNTLFILGFVYEQD